MPEMKWINFLINPKLKEKLEQMAGEDERTMSAFLRLLIRREWERRGMVLVQDFPPFTEEDEALIAAESENTK